jgi:hypothetical protein
MIVVNAIIESTEHAIAAHPPKSTEIKIYQATEVKLG